MLQKFYGGLEKKEGEVIGIASTETADRDGEVIKQDGWDLKNFKRNPVILASHNYFDFPIGKATNIKVEEKKLTFKMVFSESTQKAKEANQLVQEGILNSFSVGFIPREYDEKNQNIITKAELLEISLVAVPANPQAVVTAKGMKDNKLAEELIKSWLLDEKLLKEVEDIEHPAEKEKVYCDKCKLEIIKDTSEVIKKDDEENGEESIEVEAKALDVKLLQKTTGYLQELCRIAKKGGATK
jgi:HK97 family phage prohead protease